MNAAIIFSGTSYLGLDRHADFLKLVTSGLQIYGTHYGGSRRSPLAPAIYQEVEEAIVNWTGAPAALLLSSGTAAGQLTVRYLAQRRMQLHASPVTHPALTWPNYQQYTDWERWKAARFSANHALLTDSINPLTVSWPTLFNEAEQGKATLVVDDSHLIGYYGPSAAGSWQRLSKSWNGSLIVTASLGKALAIPAGVILGSKETISALQDMIQFGGASPPNPAFLYAWLHAREILQQQRQRLAQVIERAQQWVRHLNDVSTLPSIPILGIHRHEWAMELAKQNIALSSFCYPGPRDQRYTRVVLNAGHSDAELEQLRIGLSKVL